ncbi:hypothetical protein GCM10010346_57920 [Streptomyces chryseus]|uniref:Uncharacterized protein n=1 Tax=Streptomyces chryseus TaxID=68186 RepID=A0ABQ3E993_9ACTN|nr:hypothetical protein GCM10010346_57920 [Streptomyces chryseus]
MTGRGSADPQERVLLGAYESERAAALQLGSDVVQQTTGGLPPNTFERLHLPGIRPFQVPGEQPPRQRRGRPGQVVSGQDRNTRPHAAAGPGQQSGCSALALCSITTAHVQPRRLLGPPVLKGFRLCDLVF